MSRKSIEEYVNTLSEPEKIQFRDLIDEALLRADNLERVTKESHAALAETAQNLKLIEEEFLKMSLVLTKTLDQLNEIWLKTTPSNKLKS